MYDNKDKTKAVLLISTLIILSLITYYFLLGNHNQNQKIKMTLPNLKEISAINLNTQKRQKNITNKVEITKILNIIKTSRQTRKKSINDYPANASKVITMTIIGKENKITIYLYQQEEKYYLEQPYNAINITTKDNFNIIYNLIN